ncbi:MAG: hypothetical protein U0N82_07370, partial [Oscillospiraceae bacterium]
TYFRILNRYLQRFLSQRGCRRENDLRTIFNGLLDYAFCLFRGRHSIIASNFYFPTKYLFYVFFSHFMVKNPRAIIWRLLIAYGGLQRQLVRWSTAAVR